MRRKPIQRIRDRKRIADLYLRGWTQMDIAEELDISGSTVSRDIKSLHKGWLESSLVDYDEAKGKELAKIDKLEFEYWVAWERSYQNKEIETKKAVSVNKSEDNIELPTRVEAIKREEGQIGDPRFLAGVQWCINKRCEVLGLDAPHKTDVTSGGEPLRSIEEWKTVAEKNAEQIEQLEAE